ncbi:hypothetical protein Gpo141_00013491, partial [Globisporangium polare]
IYGFQSISPTAQNAYVILLPIIKMSLKNWMSRYLGEMDGMKPEIVIFNVEISNTLYVSICMQSSSSITTMLIISIVDWFQMWLSIRDVNEMLNEMKHFMDKIPKGHPWEHLNFVEIALIIIDEDPRVKSHPLLHQSCIGTDRTERLVERSSKSAKTLNASHRSVIVVPVANNADAQGQQHLVTSFTKAPSTRSGGRGGTKEAQNGGAAAKYALSAARKEVRTESGIALFNDVQRLHFVQKATQVLFMTEFVLLTEYTEVIIPIIYSTYVVAAYDLPNRIYYVQLASMDTNQLRRTASNVMVYAGFELASFLVMTHILRRKLRIQSFKQLAFVFDNQWLMVQSKLVLWFFYAVQNSLTHFGADFSFKFAWLHKHPASV